MATYYVTSAGAGLADGSNEANALAYATIDNTADAWWDTNRSGDTIIICDNCSGDLTLNGSDGIMTNGPFTSTVTIRGKVGTEVITGGAAATAALYILNNSNITVRNLTFVAGAATKYCAWVRDSAKTCSNILFQNCTFTSAANQTSDIIDVSADVQNFVIDTCTLTITSAAGGDSRAVYCVTSGTATSDTTIRNSTIASSGAVTNNLIVCNNTTNLAVDKCTITGGKYAIYIQVAVNVNITGNTISGTASDAIEITGTAGSSITGKVIVIGNAVYDSVSRGIYLYNLGSATQAICDGNIVYDVSDVGTGNGYGIETETCNTKVNVFNNYVHDCDAYGIILKDCSYGMAYGNRIFAIDPGGKTSGGGLYFKGSKYCSAERNFIDVTNNGVVLGVNVAENNTGIRLADNVVKAPTRYSIGTSQTYSYFSKTRQNNRRWTK